MASSVSSHLPGTEHRQLALAEEVKAIKDKGNVLVKAGKHCQAIGLYRHAIAKSNDEECLDADAKLQIAQCHLNMALGSKVPHVYARACCCARSV